MDSTEEAQLMPIQFQQIIDETCSRAAVWIQEYVSSQIDGTEGTTDRPKSDPAEYLLTKSKYHNCHLTVGDPTCEEVERIGVVRTSLISHSSVFRDMLEDSEIADRSGLNTHITDVTPAVFKLMLIHIYGGELPPMSQETAAQLVICGDKYDIKSLVTKVSRLMVPATVAELFPALYCVCYLSLPELLPSVTTMVQYETAELVTANEYLELDVNCMEFIVQQNKLSIDEVELWRSVVRWVEKQADEEQKDKRQLVDNLLKHIRLVTLTKDQIIQEVIPANILSPEEVIDLLSAVSMDKSVTSPGLCGSTQVRELCWGLFKNSYSFSSVHYPPSIHKSRILFILEESCSSQFVIETRTNNVKLLTFSFKSRKYGSNNKSHYPLNVSIVFVKNENDIREEQTVKVKGSVIADEIISLPIKLDNGEFVRLKKNSSYDVSITFDISHPAFKTLYCYTDWKGDQLEQETTDMQRTCSGLKIQFKSQFHILKIKYEM